MPLTDEQRATVEQAQALASRLQANTIAPSWHTERPTDDMYRASQAIQRLAIIIEELQAENAALREALAGLLSDKYDKTGLMLYAGYECHYCGADAQWCADLKGGGYVTCDHAPDCPVAQAHELLVNGEDGHATD